MKLPLLFLLGAVAAAASAVDAEAATPTPQELALQPYTAPPAPSAKEWPRERVLGFMHELADFVEKNHVVTDPTRKTYGMVYEFWKDGKKMQDFGLDTMHDGAWWMSALVTAQRADPKGDWLARAQKYQVPFYAQMLNHSDALFPKMQPTDEDKQHAWSGPVKGWVPRGWDDGSGIERKSGQPLPNRRSSVRKRISISRDRLVASSNGIGGSGISSPNANPRTSAGPLKRCQSAAMRRLVSIRRFTSSKCWLTSEAHKCQAGCGSST